MNGLITDRTLPPGLVIKWQVVQHTRPAIDVAAACDPCCSCTTFSLAQYTLATKLNSTRSTSLKVNKVDRVALAPYTLATKLNSTRSTSLKVNKVDRVALAPYTLATKSTKPATMSTAISCQITVFADLSPKPATSQLCCQCVPGLTVHSVTSLLLLVFHWYQSLIRGPNFSLSPKSPKLRLTNFPERY